MAPADAERLQNRIRQERTGATSNSGKLPKAEHEAAEWQPAMEALIPVATSGGPTMFARIGVMRALNCHVEVRSLLAFFFRLVYQLFCKKYFAVLLKYRRLHDRWA